IVIVRLFARIYANISCINLLGVKSGDNSTAVLILTYIGNKASLKTQLGQTNGRISSISNTLYDYCLVKRYFCTVFHSYNFLAKFIDISPSLIVKQLNKCVGYYVTYA